jgi:predicted alpha/beta-fold hydrolase
MGFSLGGNVTLKYVGEWGKNIHTAIKKAVAFSVPMDLLACSRNIEKPENKLYLWRFLQSLKPKLKPKLLSTPISLI